MDAIWKSNIIMSDIPFTAVQRIMKNAGIARASPDAVKELALQLDEIGMELGAKANELCIFAKRKTVMAEDVELAATQ